MPTPPAQARGASLTVTSKGLVTMRKELHAEQATGTIAGFIGRLAGRNSHRASLQELQEAIETGWAGLQLLAAGGDFAGGVIGWAIAG